MKIHKLRLFIIVGLGTALTGGFCLPAHAYSPHATHYPLAEEAVQLYNRNHPENKVGVQELTWIAEGSHDEDRPATRAFHHFYDPVNNMGLDSFESSKIWARDGELQKLKRYRFAGESSGIHTWEEAIAAYRRGDKEHAYKTLGHILHLIQDATVPAHTRQDAHVHVDVGTYSVDAYGGADPFEQEAKNLKIPSSGNMHPVYFDNLDQYFDYVATYSNNNFWSKDSVGMYELPKITRVDSMYVYTEINGNEHRLARIKKPHKLFDSSSAVLDTESFDDPLVIRDYWQRLAPLGIETTAGILKLFHDSVEEPAPPEEKASIFGSIKNFFSSAASNISARWKSTKESLTFAFSNTQVTSTPKYANSTVNMLTTGAPATYDVSLSQLSEEEQKAAQDNFRRQLEEALKNQKTTTQEADPALSDNAGSEDSSDPSNTPDPSNPTNESDPGDEPKEELEKDDSFLEDVAEKTKEKTGEILGTSTQGNYGPQTGRGSNYYKNINTPGHSADTEGSGENTPDHLLINEIQTQDAEFVELYNPTEKEIDLSGHYFAYYSASRTTWDNPWRLKQFPEDTKIASGGYYLIGLSGYPESGGNPNADWQPYSSNQLSNAGGTVAVFSAHPEEEAIDPTDAAGWGSDTFVDLKETETATAPDEGKSISRDEAHSDTDNNAEDLSETSPTPTNSKNEKKEKVVTPTGAPLWASWQNNGANSGNSLTVGPADTPSVQWAQTFSGRLLGYAQPLVDGKGNIYFSVANSESGTLYSIAPNGEVRWKYPASGYVALSGNSEYVYVTGSDFALTLSTLNGEVVNNISIRPASYYKLTVDSKSGMFFLASQNNIYGFTEEGSVAWKKSWKILDWEEIFGRSHTGYYSVEKVLSATTLEGDLHVVVWPAHGRPRVAEYIIAIDSNTGELKWQRSMRQNIGEGRGVRIVYEGIAVNQKGELFTGYATRRFKKRYGVAAYNLKNKGQIVHKITPPSHRVVRPAPVFGSAGSAYLVPPTRNLVYRYTDTSGSHPIFYISDGFKIRTSLVTDNNNTLYFGSVDGYIYAVGEESTRDNPVLKWKHHLDEGIINSISVGEDAVYVLTRSKGTVTLTALK